MTQRFDDRSDAHLGQGAIDLRRLTEVNQASAVALTKADHSPSLWRALTASSWPARLVALYLVLLPVLAGIPRDRYLPLLRPSEGLQLAVLGIGALMAFAAYARGLRWRLDIRPLDWWMAALAFFSSVVPLAWLVARNEPVNLDVILAASPMIKYLLLWVLVRVAVRSAPDRLLLLSAAVLGGLFVAAVAIAEAAGIGPIKEILSTYFAPEGTPAFEGRAFTTLSSAIASGALLVLTAGISLGFAVKRNSFTMLGITGMLLVGVVATGQMTSLAGVIVALGAVAATHRVLGKTLAFGMPVLIVAGVGMSSVIAERFADTAGRSRIPQSWVIRWSNVTDLYWPSIADGGWKLGVSPETVLVPPDSWRDEVFLESGYLWALWIGGVPLLVALVGFLWSAWRSAGVPRSNPDLEVLRIAARGAAAFMIVFNVIDPHASLRGGADLLYILTAATLSLTPLTVPCHRSARLYDLIHAPTGLRLSSTSRIQIGEIGGQLLANRGWPAVTPIPGVDRGVDIAVIDRGTMIAEARVYFEREGHDLDGIMMHPVRSVDGAAETLVWRGVAMIGRSMRFRTLTLGADRGDIVTIQRSELRRIGLDATRLEGQRARRETHEDSEIETLFREHDTIPVGVRITPHGGVSMARRAVDIAVAAGALIALSPLILVLRPLVRRSTNDSSFFRQMRIGAGGLPFQILKFRTMNNSAGVDVHRQAIEQGAHSDEPIGKVDTDARITGLGSWLRSTSLDELPQLINLVRGDMTLVGPRPSLLWETSLFAPRGRRRLVMVPGIAGLWQASGRGDLSNDEMLELDLRYVEESSAAYDMRLLASTAKAVVTGKGAR